MTLLDWIVIIFYASGLILLGWWLGRKQKSSEDYYLAGRRISWLPIGLSTMASQLGAISFISAPAFVALRPGGGMKWLGYELGLPLAMATLMVFLFPVFHSLRIISVYEYLERRYDVRTRVAMSIVFQVSRGLATGVNIYAAALVLSVTLQIPFWITILLTGAVAMVYEIFGGIHIDIVSDSIQMVVILAGIIIVGLVGLDLVGGWGALSQFLDPARFKALDLSHGLGDYQDYGLWPMFIGGFFLYASYYGCDQSQVQRELSARNLRDCKRSLLFNGFFRFPVVLAYCIVGLILGTFVVQNSGFLANLPHGNYDYLLPVFILEKLPAGLVGFIFIAILAASMSNLDSAINSLSAASLEDIYKRLKKRKLTPKQEMKLSKLFTLFWGIFCIIFAFFVGDISATLIEAINKIGSAFYGPIFAVFLAGLIFSKARASPAIVGLAGGVIFNLFLWLFVPSVSWLWWNAIGFLITISIIFTGGLFRPSVKIPFKLRVPPEKRIWKISYIALAIYTVCIILIMALFHKIFL